jgi:hypothetical protein
MTGGVLTLTSRARCTVGRWTFGAERYRTRNIVPCPNRTVPGSCYCTSHLAEAMARVKALKA